MQSFSLLVILALVAISSAASPSLCSPPCVRKNTTLPLVSYIPGDNYCKPGQTTEDILTQFYQSLGGSHWYRNDNWLSYDYCDWYGIACNQNRDIVGIDLHNNNVTGNQIPPSIGCLPYLKSLVLDNNHISGQLPYNLCNLKNIQYLTLPNNNLGGSIPSCFSQLTFLLHFYVFNNGLVGELPDFSNFTNIKEIHVENNCLTGQVPQDIPSTQIIDLSFANNDFFGCIPDFYSHLDVDFTNNTHFCNQDFLPCFLSLEALGCPSDDTRHWTDQEGPFYFCQGSACLSVVQ